MTIEERFLDKVLPEPNSGCWLWDAATTDNGYGVLRISGKGVAAHRLAHELYVGPIPNGMHVLHKCDITCCANPQHVFLGTPADNAADRDRKGRGARVCGEDSSRAKLSNEMVLRIRLSRGLRGLNATLAREYGVSASVISDVRLRKTWKHLA